MSSLDDDLVFPHRWYQSRGKKREGKKEKKACKKEKVKEKKKEEKLRKKVEKRPVVTKATDPDKNPPTLSILV